MSKKSMARAALPGPAGQAIESLARGLATARKRRRIPLRLMAQRMMVSVDTVHRMEHADPGVSLAVLASALWVLGVVDRLGRLIAPETDTIGQSEEERRLPRRIRRPSPTELDF